MTTMTAGVENLTVTITQEIHVRAPLDVTFEALLEQIGPGNETPEGPMPMKLEPWPGGRWYRDLGSENGHLWAHVQAIKRPTLLEFSGPLFMSYPAISNVQYRLSEFDGGTLIKFHHKAMGIIQDDHRQGAQGPADPKHPRRLARLHSQPGGQLFAAIDIDHRRLLQTFGTLSTGMAQDSTNDDWPFSHALAAPKRWLESDVHATPPGPCAR